MFDSDDILDLAKAVGLPAFVVSGDFPDADDGSTRIAVLGSQGRGGIDALLIAIDLVFSTRTVIVGEQEPGVLRVNIGDCSWLNPNLIQADLDRIREFVPVTVRIIFRFRDRHLDVAANAHRADLDPDLWDSTSLAIGHDRLCRRGLLPIPPDQSST